MYLSLGVLVVHPDGGQVHVHDLVGGGFFAGHGVSPSHIELGSVLEGIVPLTELDHARLGNGLGLFAALVDDLEVCVDGIPVRLFDGGKLVSALSGFLDELDEFGDDRALFWGCRALLLFGKPLLEVRSGTFVQKGRRATALLLEYFLLGGLAFLLLGDGLTAAAACGGGCGGGCGGAAPAAAACGGGCGGGGGGGGGGGCGAAGAAQGNFWACRLFLVICDPTAKASLCAQL
jgi:hypothetical protein